MVSEMGGESKKFHPFLFLQENKRVYIFEKQSKTKIETWRIRSTDRNHNYSRKYNLPLLQAC